MSFETRTEEEVEAELSGQKTGTKTSPYVFPLYSSVIIAGLLLVFGAQYYFDTNSPLVKENIESGIIAGLVKMFFLAGNYWRLLTAAVVHANIVHLLMNCYAFFVLGRLFETLSNRNHLPIVFLLSAVGGGVLSLAFMTEFGSSLGASGGIAGFLGYLAVYGYRRRKLLSSAFLNNMLFNIGFMIVIGLSINAADSDGLRIDNFGHLGGLLTGTIYGLVQVSGDIYRDPRETNRAIRVLGVFSLVTILAVCAFAIWLLLSLS